MRFKRISIETVYGCEFVAYVIYTQPSRQLLQQTQSIRGSSNSSQTAILTSCDRPRNEGSGDAGSNNNKPLRMGTVKSQKHRSVNLGEFQV